jgi:hypothetical protein
MLARVDDYSRSSDSIAHNSFLLPREALLLVPIFPSAPTFIGSPFPFCFSFTPCPCTTTIKYPTVSPTTANTAAQAALHTLMLTLPLGALGNASVHSTYHGTQPLGNVKTGVFACQNCRNNRTPLVSIQRVMLARESKVERDEESVAAVTRPVSCCVSRLLSMLYVDDRAPNCGQYEHTFLVMFFQRLVMLSP